jgi:hypothetical protein
MKAANVGGSLGLRMRVISKFGLEKLVQEAESGGFAIVA